MVDDAERLCVERQAADPRSTLSLVRRLGALRAASETLQTGDQRMLDAGPDVLAWVRTGGTERLLAAVNFATEPRQLLGEGLSEEAYAVLLSTDPERTGTPVAAGTFAGRGLTLRPGEAVLLRLLDAAQDG